MKCRHCQVELKHTFVDLGFAPPSNAYLTEIDLKKSEKYYPLKVMVCNSCWLVQTEDYTQADELFDENYAYFSSTSTSWVEHARNYVEQITNRLELNEDSLVIEVASNDGYLLRNFLQKNIPCIGIEPTASTAAVAKKIGVPVVAEFFGVSLADKLSNAGKQADLIIGNNVYAHVPDINDFTLGLKRVLKEGGVITLEFPHLMRLIEFNQFDTIYHEHFSYLSLFTVKKIFESVGLKVWDVEELTTHGGSLRVYGCHSNDSRKISDSVNILLKTEFDRNLQNLNTYSGFQVCAEKIKDDFLTFLLEQKKVGKKVAAYGAAAKGNTLLNFAGVRPDLLAFVCDAAESKQHKYMPGSHIPILPPSYLLESKVDFVVILPWNIAPEVVQQNSALKTRGVRFLTAVPELSIL